MTTALISNHRPGTPEPSQYAAHVDAVLSARPLSPVQEFRWRCALVRVIGPSAWAMTERAVREYRDGIEAGLSNDQIL
jgi:hypothetical protein